MPVYPQSYWNIEAYFIQDTVLSIEFVVVGVAGEIDFFVVAVPSSIKVSTAVNSLMLDVAASTDPIPPSTYSIGLPVHR
jgi:hypothetical protein